MSLSIFCAHAYEGVCLFLVCVRWYFLVDMLGSSLTVFVDSCIFSLVFLLVCLSVCLFVCLFVSLFAFVFLCLFLCLFGYSSFHFMLFRCRKKIPTL